MSSQPSVSSALQSASPVAQPQLPWLHGTPAAQLVPQLPHVCGSMRMFLSQPLLPTPSQSANPGSHGSVQTPAAQSAVLCGPDGQTIPQPPQLPLSAPVCVSQPLAVSPSQSV